MNPIESFNGSVTTRGKGSLRVTVFTRPNAKGAEQPVHLAIKDQHSGSKAMGAGDVIQSGANRTGQIWAKNRYMVEDGALLKYCFSKSGGGGAFGFEQQHLMLRVRGNAPLMRVAVTLPTDERSTMSVGYIEGRFDVLTEKQIIELGVHKNAQGADERHLYDLSDNDFITVTQLEKGIGAEDKVKIVEVRGANTKIKEGEAGGKVLVKRRRVRRIGA